MPEKKLQAAFQEIFLSPRTKEVDEFVTKFFQVYEDSTRSEVRRKNALFSVIAAHLHVLTPRELMAISTALGEELKPELFY